jgi:hypothetical protein
MSTSSPSLTELFFFSEYAWVFITFGGMLFGVAVYAFMELSLLAAGNIKKEEEKDENKQD